MVALLAREAREVVHNDEVDLALMRPAVLQRRLELAAVRGLGAPALFVEAFEDVVALRQYSSQTRSWVGRLRFSVCSFVLTRT
jgi:hypothetical protein